MKVGGTFFEVNIEVMMFEEYKKQFEHLNYKQQSELS